jgi:DNA-binding transcriptional regulator GbsR (MarR family)
MEMSKVELSDFQKRFFAQGTGQTLFTEKEFSEALAQAKAEIMAIAIQTTKQAIMIERQACSELVLELAAQEDEGETSTALKNAAEAILNRIPSQRQ